MELGEDIDDSVIEESINAQKPEQCAVIIYTVSEYGGGRDYSGTSLIRPPRAQVKWPD
jgi:hypothetical protein